MKLQTKTSLIVGSIFAASCVLVLGLFHQVVLKDFKLIEARLSQRNMARVQEAFQQSVRGLIDHTKDWGWWEEVNAFVENPSPQFIEDNLAYETIAPLGFRHIGFLNAQLDLVHGVETNDANESVDQLSDSAKKILVNSKIFREVLKEERQDVGVFVTIGGQAFIVAASPIKKEGPERAKGIIFITREVDANLLEQIGQMTKVDFKSTFRESDTTPEQGDFSLVTGERAYSQPTFEEKPDTIIGFSNINDLAGKPSLSIEATFPRDIYQNGLATERLLGGMFLIIFAASGATIIVLMRAFVIGPVRRLGTTLRAITLTSDFSGRVAVGPFDEIGTLGGQINETLSALQHALLSAEEAQRIAESANRSKSSFIAKVSHELRTPIHSITGMLRILLKEERSSAKRNYIMMARNSAYGLLETINEILDFSKAEANKLVLERIEFSPHEVIRDAVQTIGPRVEEKGSLEAILEVAQGIPDRLFGDPLRIKQILVNLLGNATKFTKEGHIGLNVEVSHQDSGRVVLAITVFDTGVGIPEDRLEKIFEPFSQADDSVSRLFTGTGLGLTIVKQFVEAMEGSLRVESTLGVGSRFILTIPFEPCSSARPVFFKPTFSSPRVAVIDGDSVLAQRLGESLRSLGYQAENIRSDNPEQMRTIASSADTYGLIIVTSEALKRSRVFDLVVSLRGKGVVPVVSILSPFEISVRERLLALQIPYVVTRPISLLDILGIASGQLSLNNDSWNDAEDNSLQSERPLEILVADDAQTNRIILTELLRDAGHQVVCVENGLEMVARVRESLEGRENTPTFDIVLTDVQMPLLDGLSATSQIRELENEYKRSARLPVVAVTAHAMTDEMSRMRAFGVDDVVTKPLDPLRLGEVLQRLTGHGKVASPETVKPATSSPAPLTANDLTELGLRLWRQIAKRDEEVAQLFGLSDDPSSPEDFQRVLDIPDVIDRSGDSVRRTLLIFQGFLDCFREQLTKLGEAKQKGNVEEIRFAAHALKGLLLDVGARATGGLASSLEQDCKKGDADSAQGRVSALTKQTLLVSRLITQVSRVATGEQSTDTSERLTSPSKTEDGIEYE
jgi:signal transduction histidine kinase/CheY-like chemotaxis protein